MRHDVKRNGKGTKERSRLVRNVLLSSVRYKQCSVGFAESTTDDGAAPALRKDVAVDEDEDEEGTGVLKKPKARIIGSITYSS